MAIILLAAILIPHGKEGIPKDVIKTSSGNLTISFIGHGTLMFEYKGKVIHVDPWSKLADYSKLPQADCILITHHHPDHLDTVAVAAITKAETRIVCPAATEEILRKGTILKNGDTMTIDGVGIEAVPAYNTTEGRDKFHPKGRDNGYVLTIGSRRIYIAGDTENIPEMADLKDIDIAFLPMNQPYTMLPAQVADAVGKFHPKILYPYHYGDTDVSQLKKLLAHDKGVDVRIRPMK
jgi:L-ascorbate metabolism protein UlaG (beta-lactamase superfamily)